MNRKVYRYLMTCLFLGSCTLFTASCGGDGDEGGGDGGGSKFGLTSEVVTPGANAEAIAFAPDGRIFWAEHWTGLIRVINADGQPASEPWATIPDLAANLYWGLTGLAIDPEFETNSYVYAFYTRSLGEGTATPPATTGKPVLVRFTDQDGTGTDMQTVTEDFPEADLGANNFNVNGSIEFGPDGFLYVSLGDYDRRTDIGPLGNQLPQDLGSPIGKVLRIDKEDGSAPPDNPFTDQEGADPRIFAYGFRNNSDLAFNPENDQLYAADNGGRTCEEINVVVAGANYGWPTTEQTPFNCEGTPQQAPLHRLALEDVKPSDLDSVVDVKGVAFVSGSVYPSLGDSLIVCEARAAGRMVRLALEAPGLDRVTAEDQIETDCAEVSTSPDGIIYYATVYEIRRILPPPESPSASPQ